MIDPATPYLQATAVESILDTVEELNATTSAALGLPSGSDPRWEFDCRIRELTSRVAHAAGRIGITLDEMLAAANDRLAMERRHEAMSRKAAA